MSKVLVSEELRKSIELLLPDEPSKPKCGRARVDDRAALSGIVFLLKSGIPWEMLPKEMGCESGSTCWRRLGDWQEAGVWEELQRVLLDRLGEADRIDWDRASLDSASVPAKRGAKEPPRTRQIRQRRREAPCVVADRGGVSLAVVLSAANVHDSKVLEEAVDGIEPIKRPHEKPGRPRKRPKKLHAYPRPTTFPLPGGLGCKRI
jgi:transposase